MELCVITTLAFCMAFIENGWTTNSNFDDISAFAENVPFNDVCHWSDNEGLLAMEHGAETFEADIETFQDVTQCIAWNEDDALHDVTQPISPAHARDQPLSCRPVPTSESESRAGRKVSWDIRKQEMLDRDRAYNDLLTWTCEGKKCGDGCLKPNTSNELEYILNCVMDQRSELFNQKQHQTSALIERKLLSCLRVSPSTLQYVLAGRKVCKGAWNWAWGFSAATSNRVHSAFNKAYAKAHPVVVTFSHQKSSGSSKVLVQTVGTTTRILKIWLTRWIVLSSHNPPQLERKQISRISPASLYTQYLEWCSEAKYGPVEQGCFRDMFLKCKKDLDVAVRASKQGSAQCSSCTLLRYMLRTTTSLTEKALVNDLEALHQQFHKNESELYEGRMFAGLDTSKVRMFCLFGCGFVVFVYMYVYIYMLFYVGTFAYCRWC